MLKELAFSFDGVPCDKYGLMIYFIDDSSELELNLGTDVTVIEDRLSKRIDPISYGVNMNQGLSFPLTFGSTNTLTDNEVDEILEWLTGHQQYKWLEFYDYENYCDPATKLPAEQKTPQYKQVRTRYKCHINDVATQYINGLPFAFSATVECDGPFGYVYPPAEITYSAGGDSATATLDNLSSYNGYLYPQMRLEFSGEVKTLSIINITDNNREFKIDATDLENGLQNMIVNIDNQNGIIEVENRINVNLYPYFNKKFFRLVKGENELQFNTDNGTCTITLSCEWRRKVSD